LERGQRVTELMKQKQYSPLSVAEMAISLFAGNEGYLDDVPVDKVVDFEASLQSYLRSEQKELLDRINESGDYNDEIAQSMRKVLDDFKKTQSW
jgi:F-type H+-transporting ATPase subunit alpha